MNKTASIGKIFVISGPSGVGKGTVIRELLKKVPGCSISISHTTRTPRKEEKNGRDYYFVDRPTFLEMVKRQEFIEYAEVHGNYYGTSKTMLAQLQNSGKNIIFEVDVQGGLNLKKLLPEVISIFILPPSQTELLNRINKRGSETTETMNKRIATMEKELPLAQEYDHQLINDRLEETIAQIAAIIKK